MRCNKAPHRLATQEEGHVPIITFAHQLLKGDAVIHLRHRLNVFTCGILAEQEFRGGTTLAFIARMKTLDMEEGSLAQS